MARWKVHRVPLETGVLSVIVEIEGSREILDILARKDQRAPEEKQGNKVYRDILDHPVFRA